MKIPNRYLFFLLLLNVIVAFAGFLVFLLADRNIRYSDVLLLLIGFSLISAITVLIFHRGQNKDPQAKVFHTLVAMGLKVLLDLVLALIWFVAAKKNSTTSVLIFFVLYLTLTLFSVIYILKTLKTKPL